MDLSSYGLIFLWTYLPVDLSSCGLIFLWTYLPVDLSSRGKKKPAFTWRGFIEGSGTEAVSCRRTPVKQPERAG